MNSNKADSKENRNVCSDQHEELDESGLVKIQYIQKTIAIVVIGTACALIFLYGSTFGFSLSTKQETWGQFGDFLGGLLNPLVGCFTLALLLFALHLQNELLKGTREQIKISRQELALSREELKKSAAALAEQSQLSRQQIADAWLLSLIDLRKEKLKNAAGGMQSVARDALSSLKESCDHRVLNFLEMTQALDEVVGFFVGSPRQPGEVAAIEVLRLDLEIVRYIEACSVSMSVVHQYGLFISQLEDGEPYALILISAMRGTLVGDGNAISKLLRLYSKSSPDAQEWRRRMPTLHQNLATYFGDSKIQAAA